MEGRPYARHRPAYIAVKARGQVTERTADFCDWLSMDPDYRASDEALAGKFRDNARIVLGSAKTDKAIDLILNLDKLDSLTPLFETLSD